MEAETDGLPLAFRRMAGGAIRETTHGPGRHQRSVALLREALDGSQGPSRRVPDAAYRPAARGAQAPSRPPPSPPGVLQRAGGPARGPRRAGRVSARASTLAHPDA